MLYRDDPYDGESPRLGEIDVLVRKNRHGRLEGLAFSWAAAADAVQPLASV